MNQIEKWIDEFAEWRGRSRYILDDQHQPVAVRNIILWCAWMQTAETQVALDECNRVKVSTVFLGMNYGGSPDKPLLFETMIFGGKLDLWHWRYSTWDEAKAGHQDVLLLVRLNELSEQSFVE